MTHQRQVLVTDPKAAARERARRYYQENRESILAKQRQQYAADPEPARRRARQYRTENLDAVKERQRQHNQARPEGQRVRSRRWKTLNPGAVRESSRRYRAGLRTAVFGYYGWTCACCGSTRHPTIDHVSGDGGSHREELFGVRSGNAFNLYRWLIKNNFPDGFQTLCRRCNSSKRDHDHCRLDHSADSD